MWRSGYRRPQSSTVAVIAALLIIIFVAGVIRPRTHIEDLGDDAVSLNPQGKAAVVQPFTVKSLGLSNASVILMSRCVCVPNSFW